MITRIKKWLKKRELEKKIKNIKLEMEMYKKLKIYNAVLACIECLNDYETELKELEK